MSHVTFEKKVDNSQVTKNTLYKKLYLHFFQKNYFLLASKTSEFKVSVELSLMRIRNDIKASQ